MKRDSHVSESGRYHIRSLYFDNYNDKALREKIDGVNEREKFRIRCYNSDSNFIRLEKKIKRAGLGTKISALLTAEEAQKIIDGNFDWMRTANRALVTELYEKMKFQALRPKTIVDYTREPFIYPAGNVRITLDYNIRTGILATDMLNLNVPTVSASKGTIILEVKYDNFLPDVVRDIIQLNNRGETAFSKYGACRLYF